MENQLKVAMAQIAPVWLDKKATLQKIEANILEAAQHQSELVVFGEALLPGVSFLAGPDQWGGVGYKSEQGTACPLC